MKIAKDVFTRDDIDAYFRDGAELIIIKPNCAYIQVGSARYYFMGTPIKQKATLLSGEKVTKTKLPYDGWERKVILDIPTKEN
jgi:hypothetical protein